MSPFKEWLQVVGALAGLATLFGLYVSLHQISTGYNEQRTKKWQSVIIYQHIEKAGESGLSFDQLRQKYVTSVQQFKEFDLPKDAPSDKTLTWVILNLVDKRVVNVLPGPIYKINYEPAFVRDQTPELLGVSMAVEDRILSLVAIEPNHYT